ncbi:ribosome maturation factor RimM [Richelia sinica]|nr:ribosome maturation factor RimM [Richelia sinica]MBD2664975.1 ribosome maturation factor RimM [Richelia sinica FACHB-800]
MNQEETKNKKKSQKPKEGNVHKQPASVPNTSFPLPPLDDWLEIGKIVAPQGLTGEVRVYPNSDFPERFEEPGKRWLLRPGEKEPQPIELLTGRYLEGKNLYVIKLQGISDRNSAEALRDSRLFVPVSDRPELEEGEYHVLDLIGLQVFMQESGDLVGTVVDVLAAGNDLLEVKLDSSWTKDNKEKTVLIPFVMPIVPVVDLEQQRMEITPPSGLLEIGMENRE